MATAQTVKKGILTIAGSGIASVGHITLETLSHIQEADKIFYCITDPVTEAFIQDKSKAKDNCVDLRVYYDKDKKRYETYVQMAEVMLREVRAGRNVLGIFYGHPGVFVSPTHRAIAIARKEGYEAKMLPGISSEDYMFADLGFDPAIPGCMTQEATSILIHNRKLDPSVHNIIWQVGSVGVDTMVFDNRQFHLLVDRLEQDFGSAHKVVHYCGAVLPQSQTVSDTFSIADLRKEDVVKQFTTTSTLYVPPRDKPVDDKAVMKKLGLSSDTVGAHCVPVSANNAFERKAVDALKSHSPPKDHKVVDASPAMRRLMVDLALQPQLRARYKDDPRSVADKVQGLTNEERFALGLNKPGAVYMVMQATQDAISRGEKPSLDEIAASVEPTALFTAAIVVVAVGL